MNNPFEVIAARLSSIENLILDLKHKPQTAEPAEYSESRDKPFTVPGLAELLDLSIPTIYTKHSKGELPGGCKRGKRLYFQRDVILNWLKEGRQKSNAELEKEAESFLASKK
ncbi:DNA-binding protein [Flagellimonas taeanensis]|uniref:helix-turn-helix transcriptional regulator n=1 Tax=Flagellimonas taeanensis TaxID=1005926 RepID=UPI000E6886A8|nr:helix-turn-helix domain-containing protein [Allomuricauda taeanensis]RIV50904.1 DNA-binding protein [Allomuricauda taeanensis]